MSEGKYKRLVNNTLIFAIGNFGSKILTFLIVPLYTYYLTPEEYGTIDLLITTIAFVLPFLTLQFQEATMRFLAAGEIDRKTAVSNSMLIYVGGAVLLIALYPLYTRFFSSVYALLFLVLLLAQSYNCIFAMVLRAGGQTVAYSLNGVIITFVTVALNFVFVVGCRMGVYGYFISLILAHAAASVQSTFVAKVFQNLSWRYVDAASLREMLKYCIPVIPNALMWRIMSIGDKYIILYFLGAASNGLYSIAMKIPTILAELFTIFMQAWQLSAIEENQAKDQGEFHSNVFAVVSAFGLLCASCMIAFVRPVFALLISDEFFEAWRYVPLLGIATVVSCFASFSGTVYVITKNTKKSFITTVFGAVMNLAFNFLLVKKLKLYGVAIGTVMGYLGLLVIRYSDAKKEIGLRFGGKRAVVAFLVLCLQTVAVWISVSPVCYLFNAMCIVLILMLYKVEILQCVRLLKAKIKRS